MNLELHRKTHTEQKPRWLGAIAVAAEVDIVFGEPEFITTVSNSHLGSPMQGEETGFLVSQFRQGLQQYLTQRCFFR